jgi:hypothetical protein
LERILEADNVIFKTEYLARLNTELGSEHSNLLEMVDLVHMYGEICDVLAGEIRQRKINSHSDLFSHAVFLVPFEQFIALLIGRSPPVEELLTVLVKIITSALQADTPRIAAAQIVLGTPQALTDVSHVHATLPVPHF